jgi:DNA mismatch repair ATPase MutL
MITKLDSNTVQRISSGQLILDIPSTLKELIENSIDAKATQISITIEDDGLTSITVRSHPTRST